MAARLGRTDIGGGCGQHSGVFRGAVVSSSTWSDTPPTGAGWWWIKDSWSKGVVRVDEPFPGVFAIMDGRTPNLVSQQTEDTQWAGPIPEPEDG